MCFKYDQIVFNKTICLLKGLIMFYQMLKKHAHFPENTGYPWIFIFR